MLFRILVSQYKILVSLLGTLYTPSFSQDCSVLPLCLACAVYPPVRPAVFSCAERFAPLLSPENNIHVHDLLTFQQITVVSKARGATLFACDLQVSPGPFVTVAHRLGVRTT